MNNIFQANLTNDGKMEKYKWCALYKCELCKKLFSNDFQIPLNSNHPCPTCKTYKSPNMVVSLPIFFNKFYKSLILTISISYRRSLILLKRIHQRRNSLKHELNSKNSTCYAFKFQHRRHRVTLVNTIKRIYCI